MGWEVSHLYWHRGHFLLCAYVPLQLCALMKTLDKFVWKCIVFSQFKKVGQQFKRQYVSSAPDKGGSRRVIENKTPFLRKRKRFFLFGGLVSWIDGKKQDLTPLLPPIDEILVLSVKCRALCWKTLTNKMQGVFFRSVEGAIATFLKNVSSITVKGREPWSDWRQNPVTRKKRAGFFILWGQKGAVPI